MGEITLARAQSLLLLTFPPTSRRRGHGMRPRARIARASPLFFRHTHTVPRAAPAGHYTDLQG